MIEPSLITRTEHEILLDYERQRRLRLLRVITPAFIVIASLVLGIVVIALVLIPMNGVAQHGMLSTALLLVGIDLFLLAGFIALRVGKLNVATAFVAGISAVAGPASLAIWGTSIGLDLFAMIELTPFSVVILLAGLMGNRWAILAATLGMNIATVVLLLLLVPSASVQANWYQERPLILSVSLVYQWLFGVIMIVIWSTFARTLTQVGTAYDRAKQLESLKDAFIASVNHELRTPLMTMLTYLETLRERPDALPPDQLAAVIDQVCRVGEDLSDLVKSILSARQFDQEARDFTPEVVLVRPVVEAAIRGVATPRVTSGAAESSPRNLHLRVPDTAEVWGDMVRLQQILTNLLTNALKYSDPGTAIEVTARSLAISTSTEAWVKSRMSLEAGEDADEDEKRASYSGGLGRRSDSARRHLIEIVVRDYGRGVPPDQAPLLFNRFVRLPRDLASNTSGNGLGLYLCRLYAEAMGGHIWVKSSGVAGEGSAFHLVLPAAESSVVSREVHTGPASLPLPAPATDQPVVTAGK
jgi:signal transduction histidine kinase